MKVLVLSTIGVWLAGQASSQTTSTSISQSTSVSTSSAAVFTGPPPGFGPPPGWTPPPGFRPPWLSNLPTVATATETVVAGSNSTAPTTTGGTTLSTSIRPQSSTLLAESTASSSNGTVAETTPSNNSTGSSVGIGVGVGVGVAALLIAAAIFAFWYMKKRRRNQDTSTHEEEPFSPDRNNSTYGGDTLTSAGGYTSPQNSSPSEMATVANMSELSPRSEVAAKYEMDGDRVDRHEMDAEDKMKGFYHPAHRGRQFPGVVELPGDVGYKP